MPARDSRPTHDARHAECCGPSVPAATRSLLRLIWPGISRRRFLAALSAGSAAMAARLVPAEVSDLGLCGPPPPPKPAQASAAEGIPPLPLPVTPQRRSEKKKPPRPPTIAAKIRTGELADWATDPNDLNNLLIWMKANLQVNFSYEEKALEELDLEAGNVPVLYRTGHRAFSFTDDQRARLRGYLLRGGMIIFDACCGREAFTQSARAEIEAIFPDRPLRPLGADHPIFNCYYQNAGIVRFTPVSLSNGRVARSPGSSGIEGVEVSCRTAVVLSPNDMSCGWDMHTHSFDGTSYIQSEDALKIGANLIAYATATRDLGVSLAEAKAFVDADPTRADKFRVGQIQHEGDWSPDPVGMQNLLDMVGQGTALKVSFATEAIRPEFDQLSKSPFVYITGHEDFVWTDAQVSAMRRYLSNGGFLFADACCGRQKFDQAFRREIGRVLRSDSGAGALQPIPLNHPIFQIHHKIAAADYSEAARAAMGAKLGNRPALESATVGGRLAVVYSPVGLNVGWRVRPVAYSVAYAPKSALEIGTNVVLYAMTQ